MRKTSLRLRCASAVSIALALSSFAACGGGDGAGGGDLGGGDDSGGFNFADGGDEGGLTLDGAPTEDARIDPDSACASSKYDAKRIPPNLYVLFDHSGSMKEITAGTASKWDGSTKALTALVTDSGDDLKVGLKFFPAKDTKSCDLALYATPDVAVAPLATSRKPIECWLGTATGCPGITAETPGGNTPMAIALQGAIEYMKKTYVGDGTRVVVLFTDGDPNGCGSIADVITAATVGPAAPTPPVLVYVIGAPGGTVSNLSRVAAAGGGKRFAACVPDTSDATKACHYQIGAADFEKDLLAALADIKGKALTCTFDIPSTSGGDGGTVDPGKVNVDFTDAKGTVTLPKDTSHANGWDYTDGGKTITIYGPDCDKLKSDAAATIQLIFGCKTKGPA